MNDSKQLSVIESNPFSSQGTFQFMMLTDEERQQIKAANPEWNVRLANENEQLNSLAIKDSAMQNEPQIDEGELKSLSYEERWRNYREAIAFVKEIMFKFWVLHNADLMVLPDMRIIRWREGYTYNG